MGAASLCIQYTNISQKSFDKVTHLTLLKTQVNMRYITPLID